MSLANIDYFLEPILSWAARLDAFIDEDGGPIIFKALVDLGADPFIKLEDGRTLFHAKCMEWLHSGSFSSRDVVELFFKTGARMDHRDSSTGQSMFELIVNFCDDPHRADHGGLEFLLTHALPNTLAASHVYEVLHSRLEDIQNHLIACLLIMRHGWISGKARTYIFEWLVSYVTGIPVRHSGLYLDKSNGKFNQKAAKFFPGLLNREQLDQLWEKGLASYSVGLEGPYGRVKCSESKWIKLPWMHINAERGDVEAMKMLLDWKFPAFNFEEDDEQDEMVTNGYTHSPLMRAMHRGHRTAALSLIEHVAKTWRSQRGFLNCGHWNSYGRDMNNCRECPYGQKSACDLAFSLGEVELLEHMWDDLLALEQSIEQRVQWEAQQLYMPRVYSHGNVFAEWIELKLGMCNWMALKARGQDASWFRLEIEKRLAKLRSEVEEIRDAWRARAKSFEREKGDALPRAWEVEDGTEHS
ncbi:hypothetical protein PFICI_13050 [Pestalotiopsis fici W106-1]|uniref:Uncharacterized protein n=1 Tax=Pestalotiopsis fici (strain W106-1 / CGMCC3.15140) TaxID=1229662 RepID=W3WP22_PESFW|nr:uncharacterized protein PFICI_13050 [Pestalotiopsis fici W106-1]ETS74566.1 hypothetical protein PFICI_13050 [Pestalotiopsis fici W106-1]